jgi:hypothetical protein
VLLVGVVGLGVAGRVGGAVTPSPQASRPPPVAVAAPAVAEAASTTAGAPLEVPYQLGIPYQHVREEGTDGLMGGLAFGLPGDTPLVRRERLNRFTIDDVQALVWQPAGAPSWVRGAGGPAIVSADPLVR